MTSIGRFSVELGDLDIGAPTKLLIRPEAAELNVPDEKDAVKIQAKIVGKSFRGRYLEVAFQVEANTGAAFDLEFDFDTDVSLPSEGSEVTLFIKSSSIVLLDE